MQLQSFGIGKNYRRKTNKGVKKMLSEKKIKDISTKCYDLINEPNNQYSQKEMDEFKLISSVAEYILYQSASHPLYR